MAQLTDLEKVRRNRARRRMTRNLLLLALFAGLVWLGVVLVQQAGEVDLKTAYSDIRAEVGSGTGFPASLPGGHIASTGALGDTLAILSDTNLYTYSSSAKQMLNIQHGMAKPVLSAARDRLLLYDRGGTKAALYSKSALIGVQDAGFKIYAADLAQNGNFALATNSDQSLAQVVVYNKSLKEIFRWLPDRPVMSVSLSDTRESMVVGCVDTLDGDFHSSLNRFEFSIDKKMGYAELPGELLLSVQISGGTVRAVTDKAVHLYNGELKEESAFRYGTRSLDRFYFPDSGPMVLIFGNFASDKQLTVVTLDDTLKKLGEFTVKRDVIGIQADENYIYLAGKDRVDIFQPDGKLVAEVPLSGLNGVQLVGSRLYYTTNMEIDIIDVASVTAAEAESKSSSGKESSSKSQNSKESSGSESSTLEEDSTADDASEASTEQEKTSGPVESDLQLVSGSEES